MPRRSITADENRKLISLLLTTNPDGSYTYGQRQLVGETGVSRRYIKKLALLHGRDFLRNGIDIKSPTCICEFCQKSIERPQSLINKGKKHFCDKLCRKHFFDCKNGKGFLVNLEKEDNE